MNITNKADLPEDDVEYIPVPLTLFLRMAGETTEPLTGNDRKWIEHQVRKLEREGKGSMILYSKKKPYRSRDNA